jgi:hypothetical protein
MQRQQGCSMRHLPPIRSPDLVDNTSALTLACVAPSTGQFDTPPPEAILSGRLCRRAAEAASLLLLSRDGLWHHDIPLFHSSEHLVSICAPSPAMPRKIPTEYGVQSILVALKAFATERFQVSLEQFAKFKRRDQPRRLRWLVPHGRWAEILPLLTLLSRATRLAMRSSDVMAHERLRRFRRHAVELHRYVRNNSRGLINYGLARRNGQRISTAPAESGMGHLVKERMGRGKPIRGSADGANLLLQVRCAVLDARLDKLFREWYPGFQRTPWAVELRGRGRVPLGAYKTFHRMTSCGLVPPGV